MESTDNKIAGLQSQLEHANDQLREAQKERDVAKELLDQDPWEQNKRTKQTDALKPVNPYLCARSWAGGARAGGVNPHRCPC